MMGKVSIFIIYFLLITSKACVISFKKASLICDYYLGASNEIQRISMNVYIVPRCQADSIYIFEGNQTNHNTLRISSIQCVNVFYDPTDCLANFQSLYIQITQILTNDCILKFNEKDNQLKEFRRYISRIKSSNSINSTCALEDFNNNQLKESHGNLLADTNRFSVIFLIACIVLTFSLCFGWFSFIHYRRFRRQRRKRRQQKELEQSVQKMLIKLPIIVFNSKTKAQNFHNNDDDTVCAICLDSFHDNEKIRKLLCSHYFHITCIDPWLLAHQNCPLCNENILNNQPIPSISARITSNNPEVESTTIPTVS